jgi:Zn-dependent M28 family amino/carboxypeptidase
MKNATLSATLLLGLGAIAFGSPAAAADKSCGNLSANNTAKITKCMTLDGVLAHTKALQDIADANGGNRASGFPGYDASVDYVVATLTAAGYSPTVQPFDFVLFSEVSESTLEQIAPAPTPYTYLTDFFTMDYSGSGSATAAVTAVDVALGLGNTSTSGCEAADFAGFPAGNIALIQRGSCSFAVKAGNAAAASAVGVIIFNQGNTAAADRNALFGGTLGSAFTPDIPVLSMPYALGAALSATAGLQMAISADTLREPFTSFNVLAETSSGDPDNVVMVGAHLDSVGEGPGLQDNGSGSAAILEAAVQISKAKLRNKVRFAWWGAEESGLIGSTFYVDDLVNQFNAGQNEDVLKIALYLNFDMIASPNYVFKIYDGDNSDGEGAGAGPAGSDVIEKYFEAFYGAVGEPFKGTDFSGRSDYGRFIFYGIPAGGLFTGAEEIKTAEEAAIWGGTAGEQLDQCYHAACDTFANRSDKAFDVNADAVAAATLYFGQNTSEINGTKAKGNFKSREKALSGIDIGMEYKGPKLEK